MIQLTEGWSLDLDHEVLVMPGMMPMIPTKQTRQKEIWGKILQDKLQDPSLTKNQLVTAARILRRWGIR